MNILIEFRREWELSDEAVAKALMENKIYGCDHHRDRPNDRIFHCYRPNIVAISDIVEMR